MVSGIWFVYIFVVFFFFSSRRRHTRSLRDWSSDVCFSDLRNCVFGEPHLQRAHQRTCRIFDEMSEPVVRHRFAPVPQDDVGVVKTLAHPSATWCVRKTSLPAREDSRIARQASSVAVAHGPSWSGLRPLTTAL